MAQTTMFFVIVHTVNSRSLHPTFEATLAMELVRARVPSSGRESSGREERTTVLTVVVHPQDLLCTGQEHAPAAPAERLANAVKRIELEPRYGQ